MVLDHSIGGAKLLEPRPAVERSVGRGRVLSSKLDSSVRPRPARVIRVSYLSGALVVTYVWAKPKPPIAIALESTSRRFRTRLGIGVGSSFDTLRSVRGITCPGPGFIECQHGYAATNASGTTFRLDRPRGAVVYVAVSLGH
jgi:hypothetical protein